jgi:hypothetical protein
MSYVIHLKKARAIEKNSHNLIDSLAIPSNGMKTLLDAGFRLHDGHQYTLYSFYHLPNMGS